MKVICLENNPETRKENIPSFDYGLIEMKEYLVMGILYNQDFVFFIIDENSKPSYFPYQIFKIIDNKFSSDWFFKMIFENDLRSPYFEMILGYDELVNNENHLKELLEREEDALNIYYKWKLKFENEIF